MAKWKKGLKYREKKNLFLTLEKLLSVLEAAGSETVAELNLDEEYCT